MNRITVLVLSLISSVALSQSLSEAALRAKSFDSLITVYNAYANDTLTAKRIARIYIDKAIEIGDSTKIARGYQRIAFVSDHYDALKYLDTTIAYSLNSEHKNFPASGFLFKSYYLYQNEQFEQSLQNAISGYQYAKEKNNIDQQITALHQMNGINELWGDYETALETELLTYNLLFENAGTKNFSEHYLASLEGIGKSYVRLNKPDSALYYFRKGIHEALKMGDSTSYYAFVSQSGTALYVKENYQAALDSLLKADVIRDQYNNSYLPNFYYYLGSIYYGRGERDKGVEYFKKIDSIYDRKHVLYPELPRVYDKLISYYNDKGDEDSQLKYLYKLVVALRLIDEKRIFIKEKTNNDYVIPKLVEEKELQIAELERKNKSSKKVLWVALGAILISFGVIVYYFKRQQLYKRRFENLMTSSETITESSNNDLQDTGISSEIISDILVRLEKFEKEKEYLSQTISLNEMAKTFETNSTYLSKVINIKKGKNFSQYINDLRIDFAVEELKENSTFRKYTIKAIANECGFKSAESFSKSFYKKHGIYPSYYLKQLQQTNA